MALTEIPNKVAWTKYIRKVPTPHQFAFLRLDVPEVLYGGAARGGKTYALLMGALQYVDTAGYSALLLRQSYADLALPGALMDVARQWLTGSDARWHDDEKTWVFPSGATVTFGYLATEDDKYRYQSSQYQYIGFDELTQFHESQYTYLFSRLTRPEGVDVPIRMRAATNPDGPGLEWVRQRFVIGRNPRRVFLPAFLRDNPHIDQAAYVQAMDEVDPIIRRRLLDGDWYAIDQGHRAFAIEALISMRQDVREPIERVGPARIWQRYQIGKRYGAGTDTAHGVGKDDAVTVIMDVDTGLVVADIQSDVLNPESLAQESLELLARYKNPIWAVEDNDWGRVTISVAQRLRYPRLFHRQTADGEEGEVGWHTDNSNRYTLWSELISAVASRLIIICSEEGLEQFFTVIQNPAKGGRIEAMQGAKDDYPMALSLAWEMRKYARRGTTVEVRRGRGPVRLRRY